MRGVTARNVHMQKRLKTDATHRHLQDVISQKQQSTHTHTFLAETSQSNTHRVEWWDHSSSDHDSDHGRGGKSQDPSALVTHLDRYCEGKVKRLRKVPQPEVRCRAELSPPVPAPQRQRLEPAVAVEVGRLFHRTLGRRVPHPCETRDKG